MSYSAYLLLWLAAAVSADVNRNACADDVCSSQANGGGANVTDLVEAIQKVNAREMEKRR